MEIPLDRPPAVRKMKVLGARQAVELETIDTQRKQAKAMRDYNPTINAMAEANAEMGSIIKTAEQAAAAAAQPAGVGKRKRKTAPRPIIAASSSVALYNACLERLRALKSQFDHTYDPLLQLLVQNAAAVPPAGPQPVAPVVAVAGPAVAQPAGPAAPGNVLPGAAGAPPFAAQPMAAPPPPAPTPPPRPPPPKFPQTPITPFGIAQTTPQKTVARPIDLVKILASLPTQHRSKFERVYEYIADKPDVIGMASGGQLVINGVPIRGATTRDAVRALYTAPRAAVTSTTDTAGFNELLEALHSLGVPNTMFASKAARARYAAISHLARADTPSSSNAAMVASQSGHGFRIDQQPCFPGRPVKCLRLYGD